MALQMNISALRKSLGLLQTEFADKLGVTQSYLSQLETGKRPISDELELKLYDLFGREAIQRFVILQDKDCNITNSQVVNGNANNVSGSGDVTVYPPCPIGIAKLVEEITEQRKLTEKAHEMLSASQNQINNLIEIIAKFNHA